MFGSIKEWWYKPSYKEFWLMFIHLRALHQSGITMSEAMEVIALSHNNKAVRDAARQIAKDIVAGDEINIAFAKQKIFSKMICETIQVGEKSGKLDNVFDHLVTLMKIRWELRDKIRVALFSPVVSIILAFGLFVYFVVYSIPSFKQLYADTGVEMSESLLLLESSVNMIFEYWYVTVFGIYLISKICSWLTFSSKELVDNIKLNLPIYKKLHYSILQFEFTSNLSLLISSGIPAYQALENIAGTFSNGRLQKIVKNAASAMVGGGEIAGSIISANKKDRILSEAVLSFVTIGDKTGKMADNMEIATSYTNAELKTTSEEVAKHFAFAILIPSVLAVGMMYVMVLYPLFDISERMFE